MPSGDQLPTWLTAVLSVLTTIAGMKGLGPLARWAAKRFDLVQQARTAERADLIKTVVNDLQDAREEMVALRLELAQERELRMAIAMDNAALRERVEGLTKALADDKRECQHAIRRLTAEIRELRKG